MYIEKENFRNAFIKLKDKYLFNNTNKFNNSDKVVIANKNSYFNQRSKFEDEYIYVDEKGTEVYKIQRYVKLDKFGKEIINNKGKKEKYFIAYKKTPSGWVKGLENTPRYLYNLEKVRKAIEKNELILFVEGEKSCKILERLGFCSTTTPFGVNGINEKNIEIYKNQIEGANIVLIPDNDRVGYEYMEKIAEAFLGVVKSMKVVKLADDVKNLPVSGDIEDWLALGGSKDKLIELISKAKDIIKDPENNI